MTSCTQSMAKGKFYVRAYAGREAIPTANALVRVYLPDGCIKELLTDASGLTETIEIDAPDRSYSLMDDYEGEVFSTVDVEVFAPRYRTVYVTGVQIFAGETAQLPVEMAPEAVLRGDTATGPMRINIPNEKINDRDEPNLDVPDDGISPQILDAVVIPEYVTVHLGRPTANADNVTVRFPDYIKNVCCSEIYPTWPDQAIRANIYCQISLVLNRIFTEWYRSRGYSYDITNSTSYDQYFVYGRNIFDNISRIVDEMFDVYIRKGNFFEPFYAEYCNGTTATCPGLKQWGTVTLANEGYSALGMLRYYYGSSVSLYVAPIVSGTPQSYPGQPLRRGSRGNYVATIQTQLLRIRRDYPLIPDIGAVDGVFGSATEAAVRYFQSIFALAADGVVGKATWYKISYIYAAVTKLAELGSEGILSENVPSPLPTAVLRRGSSGSFVTLAQFMLNIAAEFYSEIYPIAMDGIFGSATYSAVVSFQRLRGISADGVIGPNTWRELYDVYYSCMEALNPDPQYPGYLLRQGSTGSSVSLIQRSLNVISDYITAIPKLTIDGIYGSGTTQAVRIFQQLFGLTVDGITGRLTWNRIIGVYNILTLYE